MSRPYSHCFAAFSLTLGLLVLGGCATTPAPMACSMPASRDLGAAIEHTQRELLSGCEANFDAYLDTLLTIAEGDPGADNKIRFSGFLIWAADNGILSRRQSEQLYNRYFNVKFVSLLGDYNNCAYTCPRQDAFMDAMQMELVDKERGLLRVSEDKDGFYRADRLLKQAELVIAATCEACEGGTTP
jgi:hypothetical protein